MKLFDTHCHYEDAHFKKNRQESLDRIKQSEVTKILNCCSDASVFDVVEKICDDNDFVYCSFGIHPHWCLETPEDYLKQIEEKAMNPRCVAIGEIGLDYFWKEDKETQKKIFKEQLELAKQLGKPVIIHDRDAHEDTMEILRQYKPKGVLHRYGGPSKLMLEAVGWGMYVSVNNDITYPNWINRHPNLLKKIPLDRLVVETDCPYGPIYLTDKRPTEASDVKMVVKKLAELLQMDEEEVARITYENALRLYGIEE